MRNKMIDTIENEIINLTNDLKNEFDTEKYSHYFDSIFTELEISKLRMETEVFVLVNSYEKKKSENLNPDNIFYKCLKYVTNWCNSEQLLIDGLNASITRNHKELNNSVSSITRVLSENDNNRINRLTVLTYNRIFNKLLYFIERKN